VESRPNSRSASASLFISAVIMNLQQTPISLQPDPADVRLARALAELDRERRAVGKIRRSLLPASLPEIPGFEMSPYYRSSKHASGDYYDVVPLIEDQWGFVMADVAGHGTRRRSS